MIDTVQSQDEVLAFLADPASYGDGSGGQAVRRIDTHAASVFLAGDRALKVKRAVRFPFLDYSTLEKRQQACDAELAVNLPYAPQIYRGVVAITREAGGKLAIGGSGTPIEWAVEMRRFDETRTLDHLAGDIDDALADCARPRGRRRPRQSADRRGRAMDRGARNLYRPESRGVSGACRICSRRTSPRRSTVHRARPMRASSRCCRARPLGRVRRGHGDLHLGNIVLIDDRPVLFDAIEFDPLIAAGDVLYDLAFLLMDLLRARLPAGGEYRAQPLSRRDAAERGSRWPCGAAVLPVAARRDPRQSHRSADGARRRHQSRRDRARGARLFRFRAARHRAAAPRCIAVGGLSGSGKIPSGTGAGAAHRADAGRRHRALGRRAQGAVRRRRDRKVARTMPIRPR